MQYCFVLPLHLLFGKWRIALLKLFGAKIEWDANVYASVRIWAPWKLKMGHRACLGPNVICYNQDWVMLEDDVVVSQYSYLCTAGHDVNMLNTADKSLVIAPIVLRYRMPGLAVGLLLVWGLEIARRGSRWGYGFGL